MTANYTDTGIDAEIHDTATLTSLQERVQSHIDAMTPTLAETIQAGPVQVVESEPEWSEWFDWSGGANPMGRCRVKTVHASGVEDEKWANLLWWDHKPAEYQFSEGNILRYRVLLSTIPEGWCLIGGYLIEDLPKGIEL